MSLISFSPLVLLIALPIAVCILDNVIRLLAGGLSSAISSEGLIMAVVCVGVIGNYVAGGALLNQLGQEIAGLFDQVLLTL